MSNVKINRLQNSSSDHVPVLVSYNTNLKKPMYSSSVTKRCQKFYTKDRWNKCLQEKDWSELDSCGNVDEMVEIFTRNITEALDEVTPIKTFKIRSHHKFGLSEVTKELMKQRDDARERIKKDHSTEKIILLEKYKKLRNRVNIQIRKDNIFFNNEKIKKADNENELWKVAQEITKPRSNTIFHHKNMHLFKIYRE